MMERLAWLDERLGWLHGEVTMREGELYSFDAKVLEKPSNVGLYGTEIIKLIVWYGKAFRTRKIVLNYDEGWDISVSSAEEGDLLKRILDVVTNRAQFLGK